MGRFTILHNHPFILSAIDGIFRLLFIIYYYFIALIADINCFVYFGPLEQILDVPSEKFHHRACASHMYEKSHSFK